MATRNQVQPLADPRSLEGLGQDPRLLLRHQVQDAQVSARRVSLMNLNQLQMALLVPDDSLLCYFLIKNSLIEDETFLERDDSFPPALC